MSVNRKIWQDAKKLLSPAQQKDFKLKFGAHLDKVDDVVKSVKKELERKIEFKVPKDKRQDKDEKVQKVQIPDLIKLAAKIQAALPVCNKAAEVLHKYEQILKGFPSTTGSMGRIKSSLKGIKDDLEDKGAWLAKKMPTQDQLKQFRSMSHTSPADKKNKADADDNEWAGDPKKAHKELGIKGLDANKFAKLLLSQPSPKRSELLQMVVDKNPKFNSVEDLMDALRKRGVNDTFLKA